MSNRENSVIGKQRKLRGLKAAAYIVKSLDEGKKKEQIVKEFGGDKQLVEMLLSFAYHNGWLRKDHPKGSYVLTEKGWRRVSSMLKSFVVTGVCAVLYGTTITQMEHMLIDVVA